ncbi:Afi1 protein [Maudiozyma humilis]|uniref:Afi1 protein n=1 Tax=Maudiozyma humilis TaxID=51915 RepID=A0AAV5RSK4_MAUHU|nr:Afi1 protein [Kazachstania humilis]
MVRSPKKTHLPVVQDGGNIKYIVSAEFDNKQGAILKYQHPRSIPGFKTTAQGAYTGNNGTTLNLASLMIPDSVERFPGRPDFTIFMLYKNEHTDNYELFPRPHPEEGSPVLRKTDTRPETLIEENEDQEGGDTTWGTLDSELESDKTLFFLNVVNTILDESNERGANIQAVAVGTTMRNFIIFKHVIVMVLHYYMTYPKEDRLQLLIDCFVMINSLDLSLLRTTHARSRLQRLLRSISDLDLLKQIFDKSKPNISKILKIDPNEKVDSYGNKLVIRDHIILQYFTTFHPVVLSDFMTQMPLRADLVKTQPIPLRLNYNNKVLKFLSLIIPELSKVEDTAFSRKLVINSTTCSKDLISQFVMSLSNLMGGFEEGYSALYFKGRPVLFFPYMDISFVDALRAHIEPKTDFANSFVIIGTANPIFKFQPDIWDFYYDLDEEMLYSSDQAGQEKSTLKQELRNGTSSFKKLLVRPHNSAFGAFLNSIEDGMNDPFNRNRMGLTLKFIQYLQKEMHDNETVSSVFRRICILQLISLLNIKGTAGYTTPNMITNSGLSLRDEYISTFRDFTFSPHYFEYSNVQTIKKMGLFVHMLDNLKRMNLATTPSDKLYTEISGVYDILKEFLNSICQNKRNLDDFIDILLNFPDLQLSSTFNLKKQDFSRLDLEAIYRENFKNDKSRKMDAEESFVDNFIIPNGFEYIAALLTFNLSSTDELFSPELILNYKAQIGRSRSIKNIFMLNQITTSAGFLEHSSQTSSPQKWSTTPNISSRVTGNSIVLEKRIQKVKRVIVKILVKIERHPIGNLILDKYLSRKLKDAYKSTRSSVVHSKSMIFEKPPQKFKTRHVTLPSSNSNTSLRNEINAITEHSTLVNGTTNDTFDDSVNISMETEISSKIPTSKRVPSEIFFDAE